MMRSQVELKFSDFYNKWMSQLEHLLHLLQTLQKQDHPHSHDAAGAAVPYIAMVDQLTSHHKDYYRFKWAAAHDDILAFFGAPIWLTPLENAHNWITGWKPSMAFRLVHSLSHAHTAEQIKKIEGLRVRIKVEEERVEREMERLQVAMADRQMVELMRLERRVKMCGNSVAVTRVGELVEAAVQGLLGGLEKVMKMADCVRLKTLKGLLDILSPMQCVDFLASKSMLQIEIRKLGQKTEMKFV